MSEFTITPPIAVTPSNMTTNIPTSAPAAYNAGTTYAAGALSSVFDGTLATVYESLAGGNTGNTPASSPTFWKELGKLYADWNSGTAYTAGQYSIRNGWRYFALQDSTNKDPETQPEFWKQSGGANYLAAFDNSTGWKSVWNNEITFSISAPGFVDSVGLRNVNAASVQIVITDTAVEIYNKTFRMIDNSMIDTVFKYFYEPLIRKTDLAPQDFPIGINPVVDISIEGEGEVSVGQIVIGQKKLIGQTLMGAGVGTNSFSDVQQDEFGSPPYLVKRPSNRRGKFTVVLPDTSADDIFNFLDSIDATPVLMVAAKEYTSMIDYCIVKEWNEEWTNYGQVTISIETRGLQ